MFIPFGNSVCLFVFRPCCVTSLTSAVSRARALCTRPGEAERAICRRTQFARGEKEGSCDVSRCFVFCVYPACVSVCSVRACWRCPGTSDGRTARICGASRRHDPPSGRCPCSKSG
ncbi:hypothetical protein CDAR_549161 [Caerostris darwini]|uniref:Secreted protein n=1 Tax=Caerostris darwini TaxID=1538125 RepID=A0AAV4WIV2_9ARAC|nr:hypothetical protein CDAR_549161 [Caerostris darwini]